MMTDIDLFERLTPIFREVFENDEIALTPQLTARNVNGWDSLGNVRLFLEIERTFRVRFTSAEISSLKNVGQLVEQLRKKLERTT